MLFLHAYANMNFHEPLQYRKRGFKNVMSILMFKLQI
jgi:hypothetical protein